MHIIKEDFTFKLLSEKAFLLILNNLIYSQKCKEETCGKIY